MLNYYFTPVKLNDSIGIRTMNVSKVINHTEGGGKNDNGKYS